MEINFLIILVFNIYFFITEYESVLDTLLFRNLDIMGKKQSIVVGIMFWLYELIGITLLILLLIKYL